MSIKFPGDSNAEDSFVYMSHSGIVSIQINFKETPAAHVFKADLPGARKEEVNIQVYDQTLVISPTSNKLWACLDHDFLSLIAVPIEVEDGKRRVEEEGETDAWHNLAFTHHCCDGSEYNNDKFRLEYTLPENAKVEQAKALMENGVLTVTIPKEKVQFPFICDVTEGAIIRDDIDDLEEAFNLMDKMSAINHTLWTRVSQQARQIEHLYEQAVEAKKTIELGNMELAQAIKRNSCSSTFLLILLVLLALCLLF